MISKYHAYTCQHTDALCDKIKIKDMFILGEYLFLIWSTKSELLYYGCMYTNNILTINKVMTSLMIPKG